MKKTYIAPEMKIVKVRTAADMLAGSFDLYKNTTVSGSSALSRESGGSFWDDDDDNTTVSGSSALWRESGGSLWDDYEDY